MNTTLRELVQVNGQPVFVPPGCTLAGLLQQLGLPAASAATALNGRFVARDDRDRVRLRAGDAVTCLQPIVGG